MPSGSWQNIVRFPVHPLLVSVDDWSDAIPVLTSACMHVCCAPLWRGEWRSCFWRSHVEEKELMVHVLVLGKS